MSHRNNGQIAPRDAKRVALLALLLMLTAQGCASIQDLHYRTTQKYRSWRAWKSGGPTADSGNSSDYADGWKKGYFDMSVGRRDGPPPVPPKRYWKPRFQNPDGQNSVQDWYAGYQDGSIAAEQNDTPSWNLIPTSGALTLDALNEQHYEVEGVESLESAPAAVSPAERPQPQPQENQDAFWLPQIESRPPASLEPAQPVEEVLTSTPAVTEEIELEVAPAPAEADVEPPAKVTPQESRAEVSSRSSVGTSPERPMSPLPSLKSTLADEQSGLPTNPLRDPSGSIFDNTDEEDWGQTDFAPKTEGRLPTLSSDAQITSQRQARSLVPVPSVIEDLLELTGDPFRFHGEENQAHSRISALSRSRTTRPRRLPSTQSETDSVPKLPNASGSKEQDSVSNGPQGKADVRSPEGIQLLLNSELPRGLMRLPAVEKRVRSVSYEARLRTSTIDSMLR